MTYATLVLADSGGEQEETTYLGVPCLGPRPNTERPVTITDATSQLVECRRAAILEAVMATLERRRAPIPKPTPWDGQAAARIAKVMLRL